MLRMLRRLAAVLRRTPPDPVMDPEAVARFCELMVANEF
jgi:hypothetical protein